MQPCKQGNQSKYFHPKSWKDKTLLEHLRKCEPSTDILQPDSCICRLCRDDVSKIRNDGFIARWEKTQEHAYMLLHCRRYTRVVYKTTKLVSKASFSDIFAEPISDERIALCLEHYGELYRHL